MASKIRHQNQSGCNYIEAINEFIATGTELILQDEQNYSDWYQGKPTGCMAGTQVKDLLSQYGLSIRIGLYKK